MRQTSLFAFLVTAVMTASAQAQVGSAGIEYGNTIAAGDGVQLYRYDQQDLWLHGHFQRVPSYGGFSSFRPYNYRHVLAQTQLAQTWGHANGMPYSQQFWNRYRGSYLEGNLHSDSQPVMVSVRGTHLVRRRSVAGIVRGADGSGGDFFTAFLTIVAFSVGSLACLFDAMHQHQFRMSRGPVVRQQRGQGFTWRSRTYANGSR